MVFPVWTRIVAQKGKNRQPFPRGRSKNSQPLSRGRSRWAAGVTEGRSRRWLVWGVAVCVLACGFDPEARLEEIRRQQELGEFAATIGPLRELLQATPDDPELNHLYGVALLGTRQPEGGPASPRDPGPAPALPREDEKCRQQGQLEQRRIEHQRLVLGVPGRCMKHRNR